MIGVTALLVVVVALVRTSDSPAPVPPQRLPTAPPAAAVPDTIALFLGDSATAGSGASRGSARWTSLVSAERGWRELNLGRRGTGYTASPPADVCSYSRCPSFLRMATRVADEDPDVVVIAGGQNDTFLAHDDPDLERRAIQATFATVRAGAPDALIVAIGPAPIWGAGETLRAIDAEVEAAVRSVCGVFLSLVDPPLLDPEFLADDGLHLGDAGHEAVAKRVLAALAEADVRGAESPCAAPAP